MGEITRCNLGGGSSNDKKYIMKDGVWDNSIAGAMKTSTNGGEGLQRDGYFYIRGYYTKYYSISATNNINLDGYDLFIEVWFESANAHEARVSIYINGEAFYAKAKDAFGWNNPKKNHDICCVKYADGQPISNFAIGSESEGRLRIYNIWLEKSGGSQ